MFHKCQHVASAIDRYERERLTKAISSEAQREKYLELGHKLATSYQSFGFTNPHDDAWVLELHDIGACV